MHLKFLIIIMIMIIIAIVFVEIVERIPFIKSLCVLEYVKISST